MFLAIDKQGIEAVDTKYAEKNYFVECRVMNGEKKVAVFLYLRNKEGELTQTSIDPESPMSKHILSTVSGKYDEQGGADLLKDADPLLSTPLTSLGLTSRTFNTLDHIGIENLEQLVRLTEKQILSVDSIGKKGLSEIKDKLANINLCLSISRQDINSETPIWFILNFASGPSPSKVIVKDIAKSGRRIIADIFNYSRQDLIDLGFCLKDANRIESVLDECRSKGR